MKKKVLLISIICLFLSAFLYACGGDQNIEGLENITVAASPVPHAEILDEVKGAMRKKGYNLIVKEFTDYIIPNLAVDEGQVDANFFQHTPYLDDFNNERGTKIKSVAKIHYEPFGIYKGLKDTLTLEDGDKIAVPNDVTNEARSLQLLEASGIIKLRDGAGLNATKLDIVENKYNVEIVELEAAQIPRSLDSVALACMNGNYALDAGYKVSDALAIEDQNSEAADTYANILCVKEGNENEDWVIALIDCLKSDDIKDYINKNYDKSVIPMP